MYFPGWTVPIRNTSIGAFLTIASAARMPAAMLSNSIMAMAGGVVIQKLSHDPEMIHQNAAPLARERTRSRQSFAGRAGDCERAVPFAAFAQARVGRPVFYEDA